LILTAGDETLRGQFDVLKAKRLDSLDVFMDLLATIKTDPVLLPALRPKVPLLKRTGSKSQQSFLAFL